MPAGLSLGDALHKIQSRSDVISGDSTMKAKDGQKDSTLDEFAKLGARDSRAPKIKSFKELEMAALSQQHEANQGKTGAHQPIDNIRAVTVLGDVSDQPCLSNDAHASWGSVFKRGRRK